jgi:hypothetical protein
MTTGVGERTLVGTVEQRLEQGIVQPGGDRDGQQGQDGTAEPAAGQAGQDGDQAHHARGNQRGRVGHPECQERVRGEPHQERGVDRPVNTVRRALAGHDDTEHGDEEYAAGQQPARQRAGAVGQQGPARPLTHATP